MNIHIYIHITARYLQAHLWPAPNLPEVDYDLPVVVHARDADDDTLEVMRLGYRRDFPNTGGSLVFLGGKHMGEGTKL